MIYLDYAATTPIDPRVWEKMAIAAGFSGVFANPSAAYSAASQSREHILWAQEQLATLINVNPEQVFWTSGATESINWVLKGLAKNPKQIKNHFITWKTEHPAVLSTFQYLQKLGFNITVLDVQTNGQVCVEQLESAINSQTLCISILHVNNETGVIQNIRKIAQLCQERKIFCHLDASQTLGKVSLDLKDMPIDFASFSSHKCYGPKGVGALFIRHPKRNYLTPLLHGGGQQKGLRSGTLPTHQIIGFGKACEILLNEMAHEIAHIKHLRDTLWHGIKGISGITLNSDLQNGSAHFLNLSFDHIVGEALLAALEPVMVSSGSACKGLAKQPSPVLLAMGRAPERAYNAIRFSLGRMTTFNEIEFVIQHVKRQISWLRDWSSSA